MKTKIINWALDKLEGHRTVRLLKDPVIPRDQVLFDRNAIKVGIPEKPQTAICRVEHDLIDTVSLVEVSDMISRAGKMLEKYLNSKIRPVEGDAGRWLSKNMEQPEKLLSADEVKATLSPHMKSVWDAAVKCLYASTDENLAEFKKLCRPAEIMVLLRAYADSVISETNVQALAPLGRG